ncbi:MAG: metal-dependent hydrolase [Candidatus Bathyarchaeia archaeon]
MRKEESKSFAVGHFALGYMFSKSTANAIKVKAELNIPIVLMLSVIPDIDILIPYVQHRGPSHSIVVATIIFIPLFALYHRKAVPYFVALIQHSLVGDYIAGGYVQIFLPLTQKRYGLNVDIKSPINITLEWLTFLVAATIIFRSKDIRTFFEPHNSNLILAIPTFTVLLPTFLAFPLEVPIALIPPHIIFLFLFSTSLIIDIKRITRQILNKRCLKYADKIKK